MNECRSIFAEESRNKFLSRKSKKILIKKAVDFMVIEFSLHPTQDQIIDVCIALVGLFKSLKVEPSNLNGIVSENLFYKMRLTLR